MVRALVAGGVGTAVTGTRVAAAVVRRPLGTALDLGTLAVTTSVGLTAAAARVSLVAAPALVRPAAPPRPGLAHHGGVVADVRALLDPRRQRQARRVAAGATTAMLEVRGLCGQQGGRLSGLLDHALRSTPGVEWVQVNAVTGRVHVGFRRGHIDVGDLLEVVRAAEELAGTAGESWSRHLEHPGDREPVLAAALQVTGDLAGVVLAGLARAGRLPRPLPDVPVAVRAGWALVEAQPRLRRVVEDRLGAARADLLITAGNAVGSALSGSAAPLLVDALQRTARLAELRARTRAWSAWEQRACGPDGIPVPQPLALDGRPCPLPPGPVELFADTAALGSLLGAGAALLGRRSLSAAFEAVLVGVPKASRASREVFCSVLSARLVAQGLLPLDPDAFRRLDRVTAVVLDAAVLRGSRPLVLDAEALDAGWRRAHVWSAGQRLVCGLPVPPPPGRVSGRLALQAVDRPRGTDPRWHLLREDGGVVGRVLLGVELHPAADAAVTAARQAGLTVLLRGGEDVGELRGRADELLAPSARLTGVVRRLQAAGEVVAVVSSDGHRALAAADVGIGLAEQRRGRLRLPWSADLVTDDLELVPTLLAATRTARSVSRRGRTLALSASALGGLLLVAGGRRAGGLAGGPVTAAHLAGALVGARAGLAAGRRLPRHAVPLVPWHALEPDDVRSRLVQLRAELPAPAPPRRAMPAPVRAARSLAHHVREELADPLTPVLSVGAAASAILGSPGDAVLVGSVMGVNAAVAAVQRLRAETTLTLLVSDQAVPARLVTDDGTVRTIPAGRLVLGDVVALEPGDVVPADARLLRVQALEVDESGLTGESVTVDKHVSATPGAPLAERSCMVFEGSTIVAGRATAVVVATGAATAAGRAVAAADRPPAGGVQAQLRALTDKALPLTLVGGAAVTGLGALRAAGLRTALADGVAVAVAAVPEGLPLVATVAQLAAARRLSRRGVLVRSSRTVEALGRIDTVCFDKTGTLTEGRLRLVALADLDSEWAPADAGDTRRARRVLRAAARACPRREDGPVVHATDVAVLDAAEQVLGSAAGATWDRLEELPFESYRGYAATLGRTSRSLRLVVKGAPEVVLARCTSVLHDDGNGGSAVLPVRAPDRDRARDVVHAMAGRGLRVLAIARRGLDTEPDDVELAVEQLTLVGFIGLADTPRATTYTVVDELRRNDIAVRMITGDHPVTAAAIAGQLGIAAQRVVTGAELDALDERERTAVIRRSTVFARVTPEHKVRIVAALRSGGQVVAMAGDGSNDAAAIRSADVGIGVAGHGSAAARGAADLVLTTADLTLVLDALIEGRAMWRRVRDAVSILVGGNAGEVAFTVLGTALSGRAPVTTRQFLLVNLLTDMFPAMAVALAHPRPPLLPSGGPAAPRARAAGAELAALPKPELGPALDRAILLRGSVTAAAATAAWTAGRLTGTRRRAGTMGLVALVGAQLGQTLVAGRSSPLVWGTVVVSSAALTGVVMTPVLSQAFGCTPLDPVAWMTVVAAAAAATAAGLLVPLAADVLSHPGPPAGSASALAAAASRLPGMVSASPARPPLPRVLSPRSRSLPALPPAAALPSSASRSSALPSSVPPSASAAEPANTPKEQP